MNEPTNANQSTKSWILYISTAMTALATAGIFFVYASQLSVMGDQLDVMQGTLQSMEESQRLTQKPLLKVRLHSDKEKSSVTSYTETDEGGERWLLPYFVINIGANPAYDVRYWHKLLLDSVIQIPDTSEFVSLLANELLFPKAIFSCGFDQLLRQTWTDSNKEGKTIYRHFIISYGDEHINHYMYHAINYVQGQPLDFTQISYEPVKVD